MASSSQDKSSSGSKESKSKSSGSKGSTSKSSGSKSPSSKGSDPSPAASSSSRSGTKRLIKELEAWRKEQDHDMGIERLGPVGEENLLEWEAVVNGHEVGYGYDGTCFCCYFGAVELVPPPPFTPYLPTYDRFALKKNTRKLLTSRPPRHSQPAAGSSTSRSQPHTLSNHRRCASSHRLCTPTLPCNQARSASICSRRHGHQPTASSNASALCA